MIPLEAAVLDVTNFLDREGVPYMVIGGFATLYWGRPRLTPDLDLKLALPREHWSTFILEAARRFRVVVPDAEGMLVDWGVLPVRTRADIPVNFVVASLPYEDEALERAVPVPIAGGKAPVRVRVCSAEDLVLQKIVSDRARDRDDIEGVVARQRERLDRGYLDPRVHELATGLERPDILEFYRATLAKVGLRP